MNKVKILSFACAAFTLSISCNNARTNENVGEENEMEKHEEAGETEEEENEKNVKFDAFEESVTSKVNGLKIVQDETRRVDSLSNGARSLQYRVVKDQSRAHVYTVRVFEPNGNDTVDHFNIHVDSLSGNILNPDGK